MHRDVSVGNILIVDKPDASAKFCGFLHDFDCSATNVTADLPPRDEDASDYSSDDDDEDAASQAEETSMRQDLKKRAVSRRYN